MKASSLSRARSKQSYYLWVGIFFFTLLGIIALLIVATLKIDYVWRINRVPRYFVNEENVEIKSTLMGKVDRITKAGDKATIVVKGDGTEESFIVPTEDIRVSEGDFAYPGDTLATHKEWRAGILAQGMWITLKVSIYSIFFGILLGLIGGIARISTNPALKWSAIAYVEIIRGSPLLVQIFIWYFVLATLINNLLKKYSITEIPALWYGVAALACFTGAWSSGRGRWETAASSAMPEARKCSP